VGAQLRLVPRDWSSTVIMPGATVDQDGNFDIRGAVPGAYVLYANQSIPDPAAPPAPTPTQPGATPANPAAPPPPPIPLSARLLVNIGNGSVENVKMTLVRGVSINGRVLVDGPAGSSTEIPRGITVSLARIPDLVGVPTPQGRAMPQPDGTFALQNVGPGDYRVYVAPFVTPFQWGSPAIPQQLQNGYVKSIRVGAADVLSDGLRVGEGTDPGELRITLGAGGRLSGQVVNDRREPMANVTMALLPETVLRPRADLYRTATTDATGQFNLVGIGPGYYKAFAWEEVDRDAWQDTEFMKPIEGRGVPVEIREGSQGSVDLVALPAVRR
jgi:hypothetical protein